MEDYMAKYGKRVTFDSISEPMGEGMAGCHAG